MGEGVNEYHSRIIAAKGTAGVILVYISISISSNLSFVQRAVRVLYSIQYQGLDKDYSNYGNTQYILYGHIDN